jgi:hypothetical protein
MKVFAEHQTPRRYPIPAWVKMALMIAVIMGITMRSCYVKNQGKSFVISEVTLQEKTRVSADVAFTITNTARVTQKKSVLIQVYDTNGDLLASKLSQVEVPGNSEKRFLKVLQKFKRPVRDAGEIELATVDIYTSSVFN